MPTVTFLPFGIRAAADDGESVFEAGRRAGVPIPTACVGKASCGLCRVKVVDGEEHLSRQNAEEKKHLGNTYFISRLRLSCQAQVSGGDVTVLLPDAARKR